MSGFVVKSGRAPARLEQEQVSPPAGMHPVVESTGKAVTQVTTSSESLALIDGYALGVSAEQLANSLEAHDDAALSRLHGHYCALIISPDGSMEGFCDRFGGKTLYWQALDDGSLIISSRWNAMPIFQLKWDAVGVAETLRYRWLSGEHTLIDNVFKLPHWRRLSIDLEGDVTLYDTDQRPTWPTDFQSKPFEDKVAETRRALNTALEEVAGTYKNAAIFLSGGVDSSLLAALSKPIFNKCLLMTPIFPSKDNPELANARSFAQTLQLEHLLVEFDPSRLEEDLRQLIHLKGGQVTFQALAFQQLMRAIPDEYQLVIHGEAADSLFGMGPIDRTQTYLRWQGYTDHLPGFFLGLLSRLPYRRLKSLLQKLQSSKLDLTLQHFQIQYDHSAMKIVRELCTSDLEDIYAHRAVAGRQSTSYVSLLRLLQEIVLKCSSANHFKELDVSATCFDKHIFAPFLSEQVFSVAKTLTTDQYFTDKISKPVLRELASQYFPREIIYSRKRGFEVPFIAWLKGPLAPLVQQTKQERELFDGRKLSGLSVETQFSLYWSLINWQLLNSDLEAEHKSRLP
jgi:asparagine synthase (glutamine-hydrolysing)